MKKKKPRNKRAHEVADEVVEVPQHIIMNKQQNEHKCNACDKTFRKMQDLDKHLDSKHSESSAPTVTKFVRMIHS